MLKTTCIVKMLSQVRQAIHFKKGFPFPQQTEVKYQGIAPAWGSIKGAVNLEADVNSHTGVQTVMGLTHEQIVELKTSKENTQLYSLANSPIRISEVQKSLSTYPLKDIASELIKGLKFGFQLQYSGSRLPFR